MPITIQPLGDHAITVTFGDTIDESINQKVLALFNYLQQKNIGEVKDYIPAYASLTVIYDIMKIKKRHSIPAFEYMHNHMQTVVENFSIRLTETTRLVHIPVCYDVSLGIDLEEMAAQKNTTVEEIIELHTAATYHVYMIGFLPGF